MAGLHSLKTFKYLKFLAKVFLMTFLKKIGLATAFLAVSGIASAATYNLSEMVGPNGSVNNEFTVNDAIASSSSLGYFEFTDTFDFTYSWTATGEFSAIAFSTSGTDIANFSSVKIINVASGQTGYLGTFSTANIFIDGSQLNLSSGAEYQMVLTGFAHTATGSQYTLNASPIAAVPEASAVAMMLGGLGLVGFMANRRRKAAQMA